MTIEVIIGEVRHKEKYKLRIIEHIIMVLYQFTFPSICVIEDTIEVGIILYVHLYPYKDSKNSDVILKTT